MGWWWGGLFLFLAVQNDRLILGQCESNSGVVLFGYSTRGFGNWATAAQESPYELALDQIYLQIKITWIYFFNHQVQMINFAS